MGLLNGRLDFAIFRFLSIFAAVTTITSKNIAMADEIKNAGSKGYCLLYGFIAFFLFIILVVSVYQYNFKFLG